MLIFGQNNPRVSAVSSAPISVSLMEFFFPFFFFLLFADLNQKGAKREVHKQRLNCFRLAWCKAVNNPQCRITVNDSFRSIRKKKKTFHLLHRFRHHSPHVRQIASAVFPLFFFLSLLICVTVQTPNRLNLFSVYAPSFSFIAQNKHISLKADELYENANALLTLEINHFVHVGLQISLVFASFLFCHVKTLIWLHLNTFIHLVDRASHSAAWWLPFFFPCLCDYTHCHHLRSIECWASWVQPTTDITTKWPVIKRRSLYQIHEKGSM